MTEQRRIVAKLEKLLAKVDACKERLEKIPAILKRFRQSVLAAACSGYFTVDWRIRNKDSRTATDSQRHHIASKYQFLSYLTHGIIITVSQNSVLV